MLKHAEYEDFVEVREHIRKSAGDVPILYMWLMDMLQNLERSLAVSAVLRKQLEEIEVGGIKALNPDLWTNKFDLNIENAMRKKTFHAQITTAVGEWIEDGTFLELLLKRDFTTIDRSKISNFKDLFHLARQIRNQLAHDFFLEHTQDKNATEGVRLMESKLENLVIDIHFISHIAELLSAGFADTLHESIAKITKI